MKLRCTSFSDNQPMPASTAFGKPDAAEHMALSDNKNPGFEWSDIPANTRSLVMICHDRDVPTVFDDVNREGKTISADLARMDFFHWSLVDIATNISAIKEGEFADGIVPKGKPGPEAAQGTRQGINGYGMFFAADPDMAGDYFGYDGPCPPWNDSIAHHYVFTLYATDLETCPVSGTFGGEDVRKAIEGHILAQASVTGVYTMNPDVAL